MSWKRSVLFSTGFFYDEYIRDTKKNPFPSHVESLRQSMLDFTCQDSYPIPQEDINIQKEAVRLKNGEYSEVHFEYFFEKFFFGPLRQQVEISDKRDRKVSRCNYYYDSIVVDLDIKWGAFDKEKDNLFKAPKPDLAFFIPIYHLTSNSHIPTVTDNGTREWHKESTPSLVKSFSWSTLKRLHEHGLRPSPFDDFKMKGPKEKHLRCYPWLIVEYKKTDKYKPAELNRLHEVVYCQAANASGCAARLNRNAAKFAVHLPEDAQVPPVPAITTIGAEVKVWITYLAKDFMAYHFVTKKIETYERVEEGYMMQCIWTGDMTKADDIRKFRLILENTSTWGTRVFRPLMATYIEQWWLACCDIGPTCANAAITRRQERAELVRSALQLANGALSAQPQAKAGDDLLALRLKLMDLCDSFVHDVNKTIR
ncbi:hypothetical protein ACHAPU_004853 [Fusarium lateritium]